MEIFKNLSEIIDTECTYDAIRKYSKKLRNTVNGISLTDAIYYRFSYTKKILPKNI